MFACTVLKGVMCSYAWKVEERARRVHCQDPNGRHTMWPIVQNPKNPRSKSAVNKKTGKGKKMKRKVIRNLKSMDNKSGAQGGARRPETGLGALGDAGLTRGRDGPTDKERGNSTMLKIQIKLARGQVQVERRQTRLMGNIGRWVGWENQTREEHRNTDNTGEQGLKSDNRIDDVSAKMYMLCSFTISRKRAYHILTQKQV